MSATVSHQPATKAFRCEVGGKPVTVHVPANTGVAAARALLQQRFGKDRVTKVKPA